MRACDVGGMTQSERDQTQMKGELNTHRQKEYGKKSRQVVLILILIACLLKGKRCVRFPVLVSY